MSTYKKIVIGHQDKYNVLVFLVVCFLIASAVGLLLTKNGSGISPDSAYYIATGESLYNHQGFYSLNGEPYTGWTPLYPLSIAGVMNLGFDSEQAGRLVPLLCFALSVIPLFFIAKTLCSVIVGYITCIIYLVSTPILTMASYTWSEMPYIYFSLMSILFLMKYLRSEKSGIGILCYAGFCVTCAVMTRWIGGSLIVVGMFAIIYKNRLNIKNSIYHILIFGAISAIPVILWLYRNYTLSGYLMGESKSSSTVGLISDINSILVSIFNDFFYKVLPHQFNSILVYIAIMAIIAIVIILKPSREYLKKSSSIIAYVIAYLLSFIVVRQILFHDTMGTRQTAPIYPYLLLLVISLVYYGYNRIEKPRMKQLAYRTVVTVCVLFFVIQSLSSLWLYKSARHGQGYSSPSWRNEQGIKWLENNVAGKLVIYSDVAEGVGFLIKKPVQYLPLSGSEKVAEDFIKEIRNEGKSFIICFKGVHHRPYLLSNSELIGVNQKYGELEVVADYTTSTIWGHK